MPASFMQKIASILVLLTLFGAALAGCLGEDETSTGNDDTGGDTGGTTNETANETANDTAPLTPMTAEEALAFMASGEDGEMPDPTEGLPTHGMRITIVGPIDTGMGDPTSGIITIEEMVDAEAQRVMTSMRISLMGGMMNIEMTETQGAASDGSGNGIVNVRASEINEETMAPGQIINYYAVDHDWDFDSVVADLLDDGDDNECPFDPDADGSPCSASDENEACDWSDPSEGCLYLAANYCAENWDEFNESGDYGCAGDDEGMDMGPDLGFGEPDMVALAAANWTTTFDETAGLQTFTGDVDMGEDFGTTAITMVLVPSDPPMLVSIEMDNGTTTQTIEVLTGDAISIDLVEEETAGWIKGASDLTLVQSWTWLGSSDNFTIDGVAMGKIEVPTSQLELHILTDEGLDEDGVENPHELLANYSLDTLETGVTWTDDEGAEWAIIWVDIDENDLVNDGDVLNMYTSNETNATFMIELFDAWAEDYTGSMGLPGFTAGLSLVAILGACLLLRRRQD